MARIRVIAATVAVSVAVLTSACSGESTPAPSSTSTSATSGSPTPTSTARPTPTPTVPAAARAHTKAGAVAFVRYYFSLVNLAWTRPDAGLLPPHSEDGCLSCKSFQATAQKLVESDSRYSSDPVTVKTISATQRSPGNQQYLRMQLHQHKVSVVNAAGAVVSTDQEKTGYFTVVTEWAGGRWLIYDMA